MSTTTNYNDKEKYFTHHKYGSIVRLTSTNYLEWLPQIEAILQASNGYDYTQETTREVDVEIENPDYDENDEEPEYIIRRELRQVPLVERPEPTIIKYEPTYTLIANTNNRYKANNTQLTRKEHPNPEYEAWLKKSNDTWGIIFGSLSDGCQGLINRSMSTIEA